MKTNIAKSNLPTGSLYPGAPAYTSAEDVRADLDLLTETELEAIFAATAGSRTQDALVKYDANGKLVPSSFVESADAVESTKGIAFPTSSNMPPTFLGVCRAGSTILRLQAPTNGVIAGYADGAYRFYCSSAGIHIGGAAAAAARQLEVRHATAPQQRWSNSDTAYGERQVDVNGMMVDSSTGFSYRWMGGVSNRFVTLTSVGAQWALFASSGHGFTVGVAEATNIQFLTSVVTLRAGPTILLAADSSLLSAYRPLYLSNRDDPATPTGGGVIWVDSAGNLKFKSQDGTVTTLGVV